MLAALAGEPHDGIPVMLHNFMHAAREAGATMEQYRRDPKVVADVLWRSVKTYGFDGILVDIDTALLADAVGVPVEYPEHEPARAHAGCLASLEEVDDLEPVDLANHPRIQVALEGVRLLVQRSGGEILIRGNCDQCPFSLASMMRTPEQWLMDLTEANQHESVDRLLAYCTDVTMQFLRLMAQTGCHMLSNGDSPAGPDMISPAMYRRFALPWERKVVEQAHALGLPYVLHICGNTSAILEDMIASGADGLEIDYKTDPSRAHDAMKDRAAFFGNLDPSDVLANGTPQLVERKTIELLELFADTPRFVLNSGCAIPASAPAENLHAMIRAARAFHS
jgi:uroporphyrinogen decarboxylase